MAKIISTSSNDIAFAAQALREGRLVAIPTETVYGLGGNALDEAAVHKIFEVKGRPLTDPLICHTYNLEHAAEMWDTHNIDQQKCIMLAKTLGGAIWPGPLTIVCKANQKLPMCVSSGTGYVGVRIPRHPTTLELLQQVNFPVAAPSANTFGHVSPTTAQHVYNDFASRDPTLLIIDGGACEVGIESTVVKISSVSCIEILRRGRVCVSDIQHAIADTFPETVIEVRDTRSSYHKSTIVAMDSPGQMLTHYSPHIAAALLTPASISKINSTAMQSNGEIVVHHGKNIYLLEKTIVIDYAGVLHCLADHCMHYRDLSNSGNTLEACSTVFEALRESEQLTGAHVVVFPFLSEWQLEANKRSTDHNVNNKDLIAAMEDRLFRAASGTVAYLDYKEVLEKRLTRK